jgi:hypothetical protein
VPVIDSPPTANAQHWSHARDAADLICAAAVRDQRRVLLVDAIGRSTPSQRLFADALDREMRQRRMSPARCVRAGLLAAMLIPDRASAPLLVASTIGIEDLDAIASEALGDCGAWPVVHIGRHATFYDIPTLADATPVQVATSLLLAVAHMMEPAGRAPDARTLVGALRLRGELPAPSELMTLLRGVRANWGRTPMSTNSNTVQSPEIKGLRVRVATVLSGAALRGAIAQAVSDVGLELASLRAVDSDSGAALFDVRLRPSLGEVSIRAAALDTLAEATRGVMRCVQAEPWLPASASLIEADLRARSA